MTGYEALALAARLSPKMGTEDATDASLMAMGFVNDMGMSKGEAIDAAIETVMAAKILGKSFSEAAA